MYLLKGKTEVEKTCEIAYLYAKAKNLKETSLSV